MPRPSESVVPSSKTVPGKQRAIFRLAALGLGLTHALSFVGQPNPGNSFGVYPVISTMVLLQPGALFSQYQLQSSPIVNPWRVGNSALPTKLSCPDSSTRPSSGRPAGLGRSRIQSSTPCSLQASAKYIMVAM